jgi:xylulokinase
MYLGIDLGTASVKALLIDDDGRAVAEASRAYPVSSPLAGHAESTPADWWAGTVEAVRACCREHGGAVRGIGLSGQAHGLVTLGADARPLRPAILWADQRATTEMDAVLALPEAVRRPLANPVVSGMAGLSLLWLRNNEPAIYAAIRRILSPKDWLRLVMTGETATEPSDASMTLLYDVGVDRWATSFLDAVSIDPALLTPVVESHSVAGRLTAAAATELGLAPGTPVAAGLSDTASCLLGMARRNPVLPSCRSAPASRSWRWSTRSSRASSPSTTAIAASAAASIRWPPCKTAAPPSNGRARCSARHGRKCTVPPSTNTKGPATSSFCPT